MGAAERETILRQRASLAEAFDACRPFLEVGEPLWSARPAPDAWSIREVLEHVTLTDRYLLILVDKIAARCRKRRGSDASPGAPTASASDLQRIAGREFAWTHPEHMTPTGRVERAELASRLDGDRARCLGLLDEFADGAGALHSIRMSVVDARLDLYGFLQVIDLHARRHVRQMERNRARLAPGN